MLQSLNLAGVNIDEVKRELQKVLNKNQVVLNDVFAIALKSIAGELLQAGIVNKAVYESPTYDRIIESFVTGMKLRNEMSGVEEYCKKFLQALSNVGGPVAAAASMITDEWTKAVKEKCGVDLLSGSSSYGELLMYKDI